MADFIDFSDDNAHLEVQITIEGNVLMDIVRADDVLAQDDPSMPVICLSRDEGIELATRILRDLVPDFSFGGPEGVG